MLPQYRRYHRSWKRADRERRQRIGLSRWPRRQHLDSDRRRRLGPRRKQRQRWLDHRCGRQQRRRRRHDGFGRCVPSPAAAVRRTEPAAQRSPGPAAPTMARAACRPAPGASIAARAARARAARPGWAARGRPAAHPAWAVRRAWAARPAPAAVFRSSAAPMERARPSSTSPTSPRSPAARVTGRFRAWSRWRRSTPLATAPRATPARRRMAWAAASPICARSAGTSAAAPTSSTT